MEMNDISFGLDRGNTNTTFLNPRKDSEISGGLCREAIEKSTTARLNSKTISVIVDDLLALSLSHKISLAHTGNKEIPRERTGGTKHLKYSSSILTSS